MSGHEKGERRILNDYVVQEFIYNYIGEKL
jgi:hypothetical protein